MARNKKFVNESFGLVVTTFCGKVVLIRRRVPYCVQNYYVDKLHPKERNKSNKECSFIKIRNKFQNQILPTLAENDKLDYKRFQNGEIFEDEFDFPHGQMSHSEKNNFSKRLNMHFITVSRRWQKMNKKYLQFLAAYREFVEESGFQFNFTHKEVMYSFPQITLKFRGCDNNEYTQHYFIVERLNVFKKDKLQFYKYDNHLLETTRDELVSQIQTKEWNDDKLLYQGVLVPLKEAYNLLKQQQRIKQDYKDLMLLKLLQK